MTYQVVCKGVEFGGWPCPYRSSCANWCRNHLGLVVNLQCCRDSNGARLAYVPTESGVRG